MCMYVSVDSMGKEESCKAGVWNCGYLKFFGGERKVDIHIYSLYTVDTANPR